MIQRIQTIYILLAFICMALLLWFPLFSVSADYDSITVTGVLDVYGFSVSDLPTLDSEGISFKKSDPVEIPIYGLIISLALLSATSLLLYKKRKRQLMICRLNFILHIVVVIAFYSFFYLGKPFLIEAMQAKGVEELDVSFKMEMGFYLLIPTIAFLFLAIRGIKKDMKLLQSIDRIR